MSGSHKTPSALGTASTESKKHDGAHLKQYVVGFILSLVLTLASFGVIMAAGALNLSKTTLLVAIVLLCVAQLWVQLVFFLHLGSAAEQRYNTGIFICTGGLIAIIVGLSLWVMHNANVNMMPTQITIERAISRD
jgi:cytochrome o ubiquinol oxidase operon protein cyoD